MKTPEPVTVVFDRHVKPGMESQYENWHKQLIKLSQSQGGHIATHVVNEGRRYITVQQFESNESLEAWLNSPVRAKKLEEMSAYVEKAPKPEVVSGIEPWFRLPEEIAKKSGPKRWKQAIVTFCVIYTLVILLNLLVVPLVASWPFLLRTAAFPAIIVPLLIYVIMPRLTKLLHKWLMS